MYLFPVALALISPPFMVNTLSHFTALPPSPVLLRLSLPPFTVTLAALFMQAGAFVFRSSLSQ